MSDTLTILEKINTFYSAAWTQLVVYTTILLAIVGGLIPLLINYYQNRKFKIEQETLKREQQNSLAHLKQEMLSSLKADLDAAAVEIEKRLTQLTNKLAAQAEK